MCFDNGAANLEDFELTPEDLEFLEGLQTEVEEPEMGIAEFLAMADNGADFGGFSYE